MKQMRRVMSSKLKGSVTKREIDRVVKEVKALREAGKLKKIPKVQVHIIGNKVAHG